MDEQHFRRLRLESCIDYKQFRGWSGCLLSVGTEGKINVASGELLVAHQLQLHACSCRRTLDRFFSGGSIAELVNWIVDRKVTAEMTGGLTLHKLARIETVSDRRRAHRLRSASGDFSHFEDLPARSIGGAHRGRVTCV